MEKLLETVSGRFLIAGEWIEGKDKIQVKNPAHIHEIVGEVAVCNAEDILTAIETAHAVFPSWRDTSLQERKEYLQKAASKYATVMDYLTTLLVRENGKVFAEAKKDIYRCKDVLLQLADSADDWFAGVRFDGSSQTVYQMRRPRGVAAVISPWNSPMILSFKRIIPAVLTGNTVVFKPPTNCPLTIMAAMSIVASELPPGVINIVTGKGGNVGEVLCANPAVKTISLIGGTETGKSVMQLAAPTLKKVFLELGGNDPAVLLHDVVLDEKKMTNLRGAILRAAGQVCSAVKRVYAPRSRYDEICEKLIASFNEVVVGDGLNAKSTMGPLNNRSQFNYVSSLIEDAREDGRQIVECGNILDASTWDEGYFIRPTVVMGASQLDTLVQCEQFGPVIPVIPYDDEEEVVAFANDSEFGLRASVWGNDMQHAMELSAKIQAGGVFFNQHSIYHDLLLDFPGVKYSGVGRETTWCNFELFCDTYGFAYEDQ